jgi:hypothetical protein
LKVLLRRTDADFVGGPSAVGGQHAGKNVLKAELPTLPDENCRRPSGRSQLAVPGRQRRPG